MRIFNHLKHRFACALAAVAVFASACSSKTAQAPAPPANAPKAEARKAATVSQAAGATASAPRSVFVVNQESRDPFFPKAKAVRVEGNSTQPEVALDIPAILQANFHGVVSSGGRSIAYINNVVLEAGRSAVIPIRAGTQERQINVRCREVTADAVVLEVQGNPRPIRITRRSH